MAVPIPAPVEPIQLRRERERPKLVLSGDEKQSIVERIERFYREDRDVRQWDRKRRIQRWAKFRQWTEGKTEPWMGASDIALSDLATASLTLQDTLHNAFMSARPAVVASSTGHGDENVEREREEAVDILQDHQFFVEANGEPIVADIVEQFVNDGVVTVYVPWIVDERPAPDVRTFDLFTDEDIPREFFARILEQEFKTHEFEMLDEEGWQWRIQTDNRDVTVDFWTEDGEVVMESMEMRTIHDGPLPIVKDYEEVLSPPRAANLQAPSPSNPCGSAHVILVDYPSVDEIQRLFDKGTYDLIDSEDMDAIHFANDPSSRENDTAEQRDDFQGTTRQKEPDDKSHKTLTRLMCFDLYDLKDNGENEDIVFWVLLEARKLLKVKRMNEMFPSDPPKRPFVEGNLFPVKGRREGIGLLELLEGSHDFMKTVLDQGIDSGTLTTMPWGFMKSTSAMNSLEAFSPQPGDLIPVPDPKNDVHFPTFDQSGQSFALNFFSLGQQLQEKASVTGDLQLGRVPIGRSSALRTASGVQQILAQGEARPERILRRFYMVMRDIWVHMHQLNSHMLKDEKRIRVTGKSKPGQDPFKRITKDQVQGSYQFDFHANILNSSRQALQGALQQVMNVVLSPFALEMGIVGPEEIHRLMRDWINAWGQEPDQYLTAPDPMLLKNKLKAEEVIQEILQSRAPDGIPSEDPETHMELLQSFESHELFRVIENDPQKQILWRGWQQKVEEFAQAMAQRQQAAQQAQVVEQAVNPDGTPGPKPETQTGTNGGMPSVGPNELADETLPGNNRGI